MEWEIKDWGDIIFGDYEENDGYMKMSPINVLIPVLDEVLETYNILNNPKMNLVFFGDCIQHLSRISRVLRLTRGNAMLVGVGGSGR